MTRFRVLALSVVVGALGWIWSPSAGAQGPLVATDGLVITRLATGFQVVEVIHLAHPLTTSLSLPLFSRAYHVVLVRSVGRVSLVTGQSLVMQTGATMARIRYQLPLARAAGGMAYRRTWPVTVETQEIISGPGVTIPIVLNQQLYNHAPVNESGMAYQVYVTHAPLTGTEALNLQRGTTPSATSVASPGIPGPLATGIGYGLAVAILVAYLGWRRKNVDRTRMATASRSDGRHG